MKDMKLVAINVRIIQNKEMHLNLIQNNVIWNWI